MWLGGTWPVDSMVDDGAARYWEKRCRGLDSMLCLRFNSEADALMV